MSLETSRVVEVAEFREALRRFLRQSERIARRSGLTPQRYMLLLMIKGAPDHSERSTVTELAERLQLAQSTVTELVRRAEETGLIERERSTADGRIAYLRLSAEGEQRLARSFTTNETERRTLAQAFSHLEGKPVAGADRCTSRSITAPPEAATTNGPRVSRPSSRARGSTPRRFRAGRASSTSSPTDGRSTRSTRPAASRTTVRS